jgi:hypothetical protein
LSWLDEWDWENDIFNEPTPDGGVRKAQWLRAWSIVGLGPGLVLESFREERTDAELAALAASGTGSVILQGRNHVVNMRRDADSPIRLFDIFLGGPFIVWQGFREKPTKLERIALGTMGAGIIVYNATNYYRITKEERGVPLLSWRAIEPIPGVD